MALVFTSLFVLAVAAMIAAIIGWEDVGAAGRVARGFVAVAGAVAVAVLLAKFVYEELSPCISVDRFYCDFMSTQYHNMFGWEF